MIYQHLFNQSGKSVTAGIIGAGRFAKAILTQSSAIDRLEIPFVADVNEMQARQAFQLAGYSDNDIVFADSRSAALDSCEKGKRVIVPDPLILMDLPVDVIAEATGVPEAGALHAREAIAHGKHVAMVNKETDVTVGPILQAMAEDSGLVYTPVDGDQHGLLIGLVSWARELGLEVLSAGKFRNGEICYSNGIVSRSGTETKLKRDDAECFNPIGPNQCENAVEARKRICASMADISNSDKGEMTIAANALGLHPDVESLHGPILRITEIPEVLCPRSEGGILASRGVIEEVICLRHPWDAGGGGGVFAVVACENDYSREILTNKGLIPNSRGTTALVYRPYHLCGVETPVSILCAGLLGLPTGTEDYRPRFDLVARTSRSLSKADTVDESLDAYIQDSAAIGNENPIPFYMAYGNTLKVEVPQGAVLTLQSIIEPAESVLWQLRKDQDQHFM